MPKLRTAFNAKENTAEILIYGPIGGSFWDDDGITAKDFNDALNKIPKGTQITIGINSQGGAIGEGLAIHNAIARRADEITARIDGYALSAGSFIPLAAGKVISPDASIWMIHKGWNWVAGNADEMRKNAELLDTHDQTIIDIYAAKTGKGADEIEQAMSDETWLTGAEAVEWGLADEVGGDADDDAMAAIDLSKAPKGTFKRAPQLVRILAGLTGNQARQPEPAMASGPDVIPANTFASAGRGNNNNTPSPEPSGRAGGTEAMKREEIIALLKKHGQTVDDSATDEQLKAQLDAVLAKATANKDDDKVINLLTSIDKKLDTAEPAASAPLARTQVENLGNPGIERLNSLTLDKVARCEFVRGNFADLRKSLIESKQADMGLPVAANTVDAGLANSLLAGDAITTMRTAIAPIMAFTRSVSISPLSKRQVINVPLVSSSGSMQTNPTSFETGDTTYGDVAVTVNQYSKSWTVTSPEQNLGLAIAQAGPTNACVLGEGVMALVTALMVAGNYGAATTIGTAANFDSDDLKPILALGKNYNRVTLLLDGGHLAYLLPANREAFAFGEAGAYGFDGGIYKNNLWTGATANAAGFVTGPDALAVASGPPATLPSGEALSTEMVNIVGDLGVQSTVWFSRASRAIWASYDLMFGVAVGDGTQAEVLITA